MLTAQNLLHSELSVSHIIGNLERNILFSIKNPILDIKTIMVLPLKGQLKYNEMLV